MIIYLLVGVTAGAALVALLFFLVRRQTIRDAEEEAKEILTEARDLHANEELERKERVQEIELEAWSHVEETHLLIEQKCEDLEASIQQKKIAHEEKIKNSRALLLQKENSLRDHSIKLTTRQAEIQKIADHRKSIEDSYKSELTQKTQLVESEIVAQIKEQLLEQARQDYTKRAEFIEGEAKEFSEQKAKRILALSLDRFYKEMSVERGIAASHFPTPEVRKVFWAQHKEYIEVIQKMSGCDIFVDENPEPERWHQIQIIGYDPVRRELTRRIFDRLFRDLERSKKVVTPQDLQKISENLKNELLNQIKRDGDLICKELGLQNVNPEIRQVMGSLRYRYSYTQNQYFHCSEVGWFAGLLGAEIGVDVKKARRVGMLHDLGKALDHELDGSHAVIGADFIAARNELEETIHAVRAHHYDVQPENDLDFLVIAADAVSGGRPGARRSTMETYTQKVTGLQEISKRHHGVTDVFVLNGGRECRVLVNSRIVDDLSALKISQQIAKTIEDEMQYPGQIKVVVVRETIVSESTLGKNKEHHR
jgi:ribonucrease Y